MWRLDKFIMSMMRSTMSLKKLNLLSKLPAEPSSGLHGQKWVRGTATQVTMGRTEALLWPQATHSSFRKRTEVCIPSAQGVVGTF